MGAAYLVAAWLLMQVAATIFPAFGLGDGAVRVVVIAMAVGFIPALAVAWIFEITPEGFKLEMDVDRSRSITPQTGKRLDRIIMVALALALGYFALDKFVFAESREASIADAARKEGRTEALVESYGDKSIAVLPFVDMSASKDQEYFSDGISEELLVVLGAAASVAASLGRTDQAIQIGEYLVLHDPVNPPNHVNLGVDYLTDGRYDQAISSFRTVLNLSPGRSSAQEALILTLLMKRDGQGALALTRELKSEDTRRELLPMAPHALGDQAKSDAALAELIGVPGKESAAAIARAAAFRGETDRALEWLNKAAADSLSQPLTINVDPFFDRLHSDPRWLAFLRKHGRAPEQLAAIEFEVKPPS